MTLPCNKKIICIIKRNNFETYCLNCVHSFRTENKFKSHKKVCRNKDFCSVVMSSEDTKILEFNHYLKSNKILYIIYTDLESLM